MKTPRLLLKAYLVVLARLGASRGTPTAPNLTAIHASHALDVKTGKTVSEVRGVIEGCKIVRVGKAAEGAGRRL